MRTPLSILCLLLCGCHPKVTQKQVTDATDQNQLALIYVRAGWSPFSNGYDFDSLVWRTNAGTGWQDRIVISQAAFQGSSPRTRWVSQIQSLDATNGTAIVMVAEGDVPVGSPSIRYTYSWREWSLLTNGEVRLLRICANPFESF